MSSWYAYHCGSSFDKRAGLLYAAEIYISLFSSGQRLLCFDLDFASGREFFRDVVSFYAEILTPIVARTKRLAPIPHRRGDQVLCSPQTSNTNTLALSPITGNLSLNQTTERAVEFRFMSLLRRALKSYKCDCADLC